MNKSSKDGLDEENIDKGNDEVKDSLKSWILCICASVNLCLIGGLLIGCSPIFFNIHLDIFNKSKATTAWVGSISTAMMSVPGPFGAFLDNRIGSRKTAILGSVIMVIGFFCSSFAPNILVIIITYSLIGGLGCGIIYNVSYSVVTKAFDKYQAFAVGLLSAGLSVGYIILPPLVRYLCDNIGLWNTYRAVAGMSVICCFMSFVYPSFKPHIDENRNVFSNDLSLMRIPAFIAVTILHSFAFFGYYTPIQHMLRYAEEQGVPKNKTSLFMTYFGVATCINRIIIGRVLVCFNHIYHLPLYVSQVSLVCVGVATILTCQYNSSYSYTIYFIVYGLFDAGFLGQQCTIVLKCVGPRHLSMAWGIFTLCFSIAIIFGAPVGGLLADIYQSYHATFYFAGAIIIASGILLSIVPRCRRETFTERSLVHTIEENLKVVDRETCL